MGIINVTPDSFSDGGQHNRPEEAAICAERMVAEGAAVLDVGGESTRPGAEPVSEQEQIARVVPAIEAIRQRIGNAAAITIDTTRGLVARAALEAGADAINDVSAGMDDAGVLALAAERGVGIVLMHRLTTPRRDVFSHQYATPPAYGDVVESVRGFLQERAGAALQAGVQRECIVVDPGLGFGKSVEQNLALIDGTARLCDLGFAVLSGLSRKSFTAAAAGLEVTTPPSQRVQASVALSVRHWRAGASIFRVHDVAPHRLALGLAGPGVGDLH